jgi:hypothetical protein
MPEILHVIPARDAASWSRWIDREPHDFYHTAAYHRFSEQCGEGEAFLAVYGSADRFLAWPYLLRPIGQASGLCDVSSVYGYAGPVARGPCDDLFLARARAAVEEVWISQGAVSAFTRFHPLLENHRLADPSSLHPGGETIALDLTLPEPGYPAGLRKDLRRLRRLGLVTVVEDDWSRADRFLGLYYDTMRRNHAAPYYYFSPQYFGRLKQALGPCAFLALTLLDGEVAAAAVVIEYQGVAHYHFSASSDRYLPLGTTKLLLDDVRRWAAARGNRVFHLGGGRGGARDSLFWFKSRFSPRRHAFYTGRSILDRSCYDRLAAGHIAAGGYFPVYRAAKVSS